MDDELNDIDNISELKLLESLDLGHRKVFKEESKQKENDDFVNDINLLLSKLNERINIMKNIPKLEIKSFDIESVKSNQSNKSNKSKIKLKNNPNSQNLLNTNLNNNFSKVSDTNNLVNLTSNTPYPLEDSTNNNLINRKFIIPESINEKTNANNNNLNNNNIISNNNEISNNNSIISTNNNIISNNKNIISNNNNIISNNNNIVSTNNNIEAFGEEYIDGDLNPNGNDLESIQSLENENNKSNNTNNKISNNLNSKKENISNKDEKDLKKNSEGEKSQKDLLGNTSKEIIENNIPNTDKDEIEINKNNLEDIVSNVDDIPEISEKLNPAPEENNNNLQPSQKKEIIESANYLKSNINEEEENNNNKNENEMNPKKENIEEKKDNEEQNKIEVDKDFKIDVDEIEFFEPVGEKNNEEAENDKLKPINNNEANLINETEKKSDKIETEGDNKPKDVKEEKKEKEKDQLSQKDILEEKKETGEDQYDKEFNKIKFDYNRIASVMTNNNIEQPQVNSNKNENDSNNKEKEIQEEEEENKSEKEAGENKENKDKENESKNKSKEPTLKKEEGSVEIESMSEKKEEEIEIITEGKIIPPEANNNLKKTPEPEDDKKDKKKSNDDNKNEIIVNNDFQSDIDSGKISPNSRNRQSQINKNNTMPQKYLDHPINNQIKKSLTQKGDILIRIRRVYTKTEKDESSPDISNIDEYPVLKNINTQEKALNEIITDFNEMILKKENQQDIDNRKNILVKKGQIVLKIKEGQDYSTFFSNLEVSHPQLMEEHFNSENFNSKIKRNSEFEEKLFNNLAFDEINSPVGPIEDFDSFSQKYILEKEDIKQNLKSHFSNWRKILGDGNSFYRIIMFSILEAYILNKNIHELKILIYDMISDENIKLYEDKNVSVEICFMIFAEILFLLEDDNTNKAEDNNKDDDNNKTEETNKAYDVLVKAYSLKDGSFDKLLIIYLRHTLAIYTENVKQTLGEEDLKEIDNTNIFNSYSIESYNMEPSFLNICCVNYIFDIKINLIYLQGGLSNPEYREINLVGEEEDFPFINIGFFYSSYHKLYPKNFEVNYNYNFPLTKPIFKQLTCILKDTRHCEECKLNTEHIIFYEKKFIICKNCLEKILSKICNFRSDSFEKNGFLGLEYYTRPINLKDSYYIDDYEIIELLESSNIMETLIQKYVGVVCEIHKKEEKTIQLKCGCELCQKCLIEKTLKITNEIKFLNEFEKKQIRGVKCTCGRDFDIDSVLKFIAKEGDKKEALKRLQKYVQTFCILCIKQLREEDSKKNVFLDIDIDSKYKKIKMKKMNGEGLEAEINESDHLICEDCYKKYMKRKYDLDDDDYDDDDEDNKDNKEKSLINFEKGIIFCSICCKNHFFKIAQNEACCANDCILY